MSRSTRTSTTTSRHLGSTSRTLRRGFCPHPRTAFYHCMNRREIVTISVAVSLSLLFPILVVLSTHIPLVACCRCTHYSRPPRRLAGTCIEDAFRNSHLTARWDGFVDISPDLCVPWFHLNELFEQARVMLGLRWFRCYLAPDSIISAKINAQQVFLALPVCAENTGRAGRGEWKLLSPVLRVDAILRLTHRAPCNVRASRR